MAGKTFKRDELFRVFLRKVQSIGRSPIFITFEGIEGSGKSTQMRLLREYLEKRGHGVLTLREPGGTSLGERVRSMLLTVGDEEIDPRAELFLYEACRAQLVSRVILPALRAGRIVLSDRFTDSTLAYQGYGRGLDAGRILSVNDFATGGLVPDLTFLLDVDVEAGLRRAMKRMDGDAAHQREDRFEREEAAFHERVRSGFLEIARREAERVRVIDGRGEIHSIHREICAIMDELLS